MSPSSRIYQTSSKLIRLVLVCLVSLLVAPLVMAQLTTGSISGTVQDETNAVLPGVEVIVTNVDTGVARNAISDDQGRYSAPNLSPGPYRVRAELAGFQVAVRDGIELTVGRRAVVDMVMQVGAVTEEVVVTGEAALLETTTATVSNLVSERQVMELPLNGRDLTSLTYLQPGVLKVPQRNRQGVFSGMGNKLSVSGARQTHNLYLSDGLVSGDIANQTAGATGGSTGVETVKEFQVITNNYSAEYKSAAGAIISMVTKSGTNQFHGSLFEFHRNDNLDASNFFDNSFGNEKPEFKRNQFGGSIGGPVVPDKTFFFFSYEGLRESRPFPEELRMPSEDAKRGILPDGDGGFDVIEVAPDVLPYLALYPTIAPNSLDFGDGTVALFGVQDQTSEEDFVTAKFDHQFVNQKLGSLSGTWTLMRSTREEIGTIAQLNNDPEDGGGANLVSDRDAISVSHTSILSPTAINVFRFGWSKTGPTGDIPISTQDFSGLLFNDNPFGLIGILEPGEIVDSIGFRVNQANYGLDSFTWSNDFSLNRGNHSFKIGGIVNRWVMDQNTHSAGVHGIWEFRRFENFLRDEPRRFEVFLPSELVNLDDFDIEPGWEFSGQIGNRTNWDLRQLGMGFYFQDNWRAHPSLTLNLGLRYSFVTIPSEINGASASLRRFGDEKVTIGPYFGNNPWKKSFSPRIGIAWAVNQKTSLRTGFGMFYVHPGYYHIRSAPQVMPPFVLSARADAGRGAFRDVDLDFPRAFFTQGDLIAGRVRPNIRPPQYQQENTYMMRWSMTLQREFGSNRIGSVGYTGSRGLHLWIMERGELNKWEGYPNNVPWQEKRFVEDLGEIFPNFGVLRPQIPAANSKYHGLSASFQQRFRDGVQFQLSYTFSKNIDQGSGVTSNGDNLPQQQRGVYLFDLEKKIGLSSHHITNNFVANFTWELPGDRLEGLGGALLGGWQLNGILSLIDGPPLTVEDIDGNQDDAIGQDDLLMVSLATGGDNNPVLGGPDQYYDPTPFIPGACRGGVYCQEGDPDYQPGYFGTVGRNTLIGPGFASFDLSLFKNIEISENTGFQFRAEFFNIMNRANFSTPVTEAIVDDGERNGAAGRITETVGSARQIQFGLKFLF